MVGVGVVLALGVAAVGVGTETDGSILCPSSVAGLVGLKPTVGLVSRSGIVPIAFSQDTAGPMCRSVADAATLLWAIAGPDPRDAAYEQSDDMFNVQMGGQGDDPSALATLRAGWAKNAGGSARLRGRS